MNDQPEQQPDPQQQPDQEQVLSNLDQAIQDLIDKEKKKMDQEKKDSDYGGDERVFTITLSHNEIAGTKQALSMIYQFGSMMALNEDDPDDLDEITKKNRIISDLVKRINKVHNDQCQQDHDSESDDD